MKILVIGATGKVGSILVRKLLEKKADVRVLCRSAERVASLPKEVETVVADLIQNVDEAAETFKGVDAVFMLNPFTPSETTEGLLAVQYARAAGVRKFVYQSVHRLEEVDYIPHIAPKLAIERAIKGSGMQWTIVRPSYFFQNDANSKPGLEKGLYTAPVGPVGVSSVDAGDIAEAEANILTEGGHEGKVYNLVGPDVITGETCAATWSEVTGKQIRYVGNVDGWRAATKAFMPPWINSSLGMMYKNINDRGMLSEGDDVKTVATLLKRPARSYRDFVAQLAGSWGMSAK
jgi:uncharacterized protein YbjT (DUF2867 family)